MKAKKLSLPKLHLACSDSELRPSLNYVLVTKDNIVATNDRILVVHKTKDVFNDVFIASMPERFLIHYKSWQQLCRKHDKIRFIDGLIEQTVDTCVHIFKPIYETEEFKYVQWEAAIPKTKPSPIKNIGVNPNLLKRLSDAMSLDDSYMGLILFFYDKHKAIYVKHKNIENNSYGIIMPVMIDN